MLRLDGDVFLFGTAMVAPISFNATNKTANKKRALQSATCFRSQRRTPALFANAKRLYRFCTELQGLRDHGKRCKPYQNYNMDHLRGRKSMILPTTLTAVGIAALINLWLAIRCGQVRTSEKVSIGDGGNEALIRRMRAHSNFSEFTPIVLILIGTIEYAVGTSLWLWAVMSIYMIGRLAHGIGMDGKGPLAGGRSVGILTTFLITLGLGIYALAIPHLATNQVTDVPVEAASVGR